jgi:hypothetical protein
MPQPTTAQELWAASVAHAEKTFGSNHAGMASFYRSLLLAAMTDIEERDAEIAAQATPKCPAGWDEASTTICGVPVTVHFDMDGVSAKDVHDWRIYAGSSGVDLAHLIEEGDSLWKLIERAIDKRLNELDADSAEMFREAA